MFKGGRTHVQDEERSVRRPSVASDDVVENSDKKVVKDGASQSQNFHMNFQKFHALLSMTLLQLCQDIISFAQDGFRKCRQVRTKRRQWPQPLVF
jgi:hypothetical protein